MLPPHMKAKPLWQLQHINTRLAECGYEGHEELGAWWHGSHPQLDGETAINALLSDRFAEVLQIIERLESGAYL